MPTFKSRAGRTCVQSSPHDLFGKQRRYRKLNSARLRVTRSCFTNVYVAYPITFIDQVVSWPVAITHGASEGEVAVDHDGMVEPEFLCLCPNRVDVLFPFEFRAVNTDHLERSIGELCLKFAHPSKRAIAVLALKSPEADQDNPARELCNAEGCAVQPLVRACLGKFG